MKLAALSNYINIGYACFILRRIQLNGATKHIAGGMNEHGVPGNESELGIKLIIILPSDL